MSFTAILTVSRLFALYHTVFLFELCHRLGGQKNSWMMGLVGLWFVLRAAWRLMAWSVWDLSHWTGDPGGDGEHPLWGRPGGDRPEGWGQEEPHGTQKKKNKSYPLGRKSALQNPRLWWQQGLSVPQASWSGHNQQIDGRNQLPQHTLNLI